MAKKKETRGDSTAESPEVTIAINDLALVSDAASSQGLTSETVDRWITAGLITPRPWHNGKRLVRISEVREINENRPKRGRPSKKPIQKNS